MSEIKPMVVVVADSHLLLLQLLSEPMRHCISRLLCATFPWISSW